MDYTKSELLKVLQEPLAGLVTLKKDLKAGSTLFLYTEVLTAYLSGDISGLIRLNDEAKKHASPVIRALVKTRLAIREDKVTSGVIADLMEAGLEEPDWYGEALIISGFASESIGHYQEAKDLYYDAFKAFEEMDCPVKSLKALHNYISAASKVDPERSYFAEFHMIIRKAKAIRHLDIAGSALNNLAREFQKLKAYKTALKYSHRALLVLGPVEGTYHHHMALLNRCHILCDLQRFELAHEDFQILAKSPYADIKTGLIILEEIMTAHKNNPADIKMAHPTWLERLAEGKNTEEPLSDLEDRLLVLLSCKPRDKYYLIQDLYGEKIDLEAAENRLKNIISRLRKKRPGKIVFTEGYYSLVDGTQMDVG